MMSEIDRGGEATELFVCNCVYSLIGQLCVLQSIALSRTPVIRHDYSAPECTLLRCPGHSCSSYDITVAIVCLKCFNFSLLL